MPYLHRRAKRWPLALAAAGAAWCWTGVLPSAPADGNCASLRELLAERNRILAQVAGAPEAERQAAGRRFLESVPWEHICELCREGSPGVQPEDEGLLKNLIRGRLAVSPPPARELAATLTHPLIRSACQQEIVKYAGHVRDSLRATPDGEILARAFLELADSGLRHPAINRRLEVGASYLWADEELMRRMMAHCRSGDGGRLLHGITMLEGSADERAGDSLLVLLKAFAHEIGDFKTKAVLMNATATRAGGAAFETLLRLYEEASDRQNEHAALRALVLTQDRRALVLLLDAYGDHETGIADSTFSPANEERQQFYHDLWFYTRLAEPVLMGYLRSRAPQDVALAVELLDRQSRFGLPASRPEIYEVLHTAADTAGSDLGQRLTAILRRFQSFPEPRQNLGTARSEPESSWGQD